MHFPKEFLWGAATSAYQIEGSPLADSAGASVWHRFSHTPGTTLNGDTGDVACDHYRRWQEDIEWMRRLGLNAYRFSVAWGRVLPTGRGAVNHKGLDFYKRLVDGLLGTGITPLITLHHWDVPAELQDLGGWANRDCAKWFADYACLMFRALGDRVHLWVTLNERGWWRHWVTCGGSTRLECATSARRRKSRTTCYWRTAKQCRRCGGWGCPTPKSASC